MDAAVEEGKAIGLGQGAILKTEGKAHKSVRMTSYRRVMQPVTQRRRATSVTGQLAWRVGCVGGWGGEGRGPGKDNLGR